MSIWAVTSYYNPAHYRRRFDNYQIFRDRLNIPLLAVELSFDGTFELGSSDADNLVQLQAVDVMWQKERLLNIALQQLPGECQQVAWLDCDLVFEQPDWAQRTSKALESYPLVAPFDKCYELSREAGPNEIERGHCYHRGKSLVKALSSGLVDASILFTNSRAKGYNAGFAWAARRDLFQNRGLYDACIVGSGDRALLFAALGQFEAITESMYMNQRWREHYLAWAQPFFTGVHGRIGVVEGAVFHLWHGDLSNRNYRERHEAFTRFDFDPVSDLAIDEQGCWRWNSDKPEMHQYLRQYFASRKEDG